MSYTEGYIVQTEVDMGNCLNIYYDGPSRKKSWPLQDTDIQTSIETGWVDNYLTQNASSMKLYELIFDDVTLKRYVSECKKRCLNIRILYIRDLNYIKSTIDAAKFVAWGYDLLYVCLLYTSPSPRDRG